MRRQFRLSVGEGFELDLLARSHGWSDLAPFCYPAAEQGLALVLEQGGQAFDVLVRPRGGRLLVDAAARRDPGRAGWQELRRRLVGMLRLEEDLEEFWERCRAEPELRWVARRGAGRVLRGASVFEDLMKLLFTTNCSWAATRLMSQRLVEALGAAAPSGQRAFPGAESCAAQDEGFYREVVRVGYRARHCVALARGFAAGELSEEQFLDPGVGADELRRRVLALPGFGPYAAGQAMRLFGCYTDLALDSWCRARLKELDGRGRAPSDGAVRRRFARFAPYQGLALWMRLTAEWHGEEVS